MNYNLKIIILIILSYFSIVSFAQTSVFLTDVENNIIINGNDLYYLDGYDVYKADISDPDAPIFSFVFDSDEPGITNGGVLSIGIKDSNFYFSTLGDAGLVDLGKINKKDLSDIGASSIEVTSDFAIGVTDIDFYGDWLYTSNLINGNLFRRYNISGSLPVSGETYITRDLTGLTVSSSSMYFSESVYDGVTIGDGEIYFKNLFFDSPEVLKFTANGWVHDLYFFEGMLYFTDDDGLKRINPVLAVPTSELLVSNLGFGELQKIQIKAYVSGDKYLFVTQPTNNRILKIDLNHPTLSTNNIEKSIPTIYPNPVTNEIKIVSEQNIKKIQIYNTVGKLVINSLNDFNTLEFDMNISALPKGVFLLKLISEDGNYTTHKIIKK